MKRYVMAATAFVVVTLAVLQAAVLALLPMANQWRPEIEQLLSERFQAEVTLSEIGARTSWTGPYLEALNLVIDRAEAHIEVRRVQLLVDLPKSVWSGELVIDQLILDEGEFVSHSASATGGMPDPQAWGAVLDRIQKQLAPLGAVKLHRFDVLAGAMSAKRLSLEITPGVGLLARTRLVTEQVALPITLDWRFADDLDGAHELRLESAQVRVPLPIETPDELIAEVAAGLWLSVPREGSVRGQFQVTADALPAIPLRAELSGFVQLSGGADAQILVTETRLEAPGIQLPQMPLTLAWQDGRLHAALPELVLDGEGLFQLLESTAPDPKLQRLLTGNRPQIGLSNVRIDWQPGGMPTLDATVTQFAIEAFGGIPRIGPLNGELYAEGTRGVFRFASESGDFALPDIFPNTWRAQRLAGVLAFDRQSDGLLIRGHDLQVVDANQHVRGDLLLDLPKDREQSLHVELTADANRVALPALLPLDLDPEIREFLLRGIEQVDVRAGRISYSGPMGEFVDRSRRELSMRFPMANYRLTPLTQWPTFVGDEGVVQFAEKRAHVQLKRPEFGGLQVSEVTVAQTRDDPQVLSIRGGLTGAAQTALDVLEAAGIKPEALGRDVIFSGQLRGDVDLLAPIEGESTRGTVQIETDDLTLAVNGLKEPINALSGRATYDLSQGLQARGLTGSLLGDAITADVTADRDGVQVKATGRLQTVNVSALAGLGFSEELLTGASDWQAEVTQQDGRVRVLLRTEGVGLESRLPYPLGKPAEMPGPIVVELVQDAESHQMNARLFSETEISARLDRSPLALSVTTPTIDLLGWAQLPDDGGDSALSLLLNLDTVQIGETVLRVDQAAVQLQPDSVAVSFAGEELAGQVQRLGEAPVSINLEYVMLPAAGEFLAPPEADPLLDFDPGTLPSAMVQIGELRRGDKRYQDLEMTVVSGESRLDVTRLAFTRDGQRFVGEMAWTGATSEAGAKTALVLRAEGSSLGGFLRVNEAEPLLEAKTGQFSADLSWQGSPLGFSMLTSRGQVSLRLSDGRFFDLGNSAEVLRLFGILNIDTLTRRLRLDFLDLVQPGVAFDEVSATGRLEDGVLRLDPELVMQGPSVSFRLTGLANLAEQTLDQRLEVDIPLTNNLPLASVLLGAPQVGGAIYLVEKALGTKIIKVGKTDYRIEGSFDDPTVKLIPPFSKQKDASNADAAANPQ